MSEKTYIIAEAGVNHNGSLSTAKQLVDAAKSAGASAIKFQTFKTEKLVGKTAPKADYQKASNQSESQYDMLKALELSAEDHIELLNYCRSKEIEFLSTPFDLESLEFLVNELKVKRIKIGSGEITNAPLLLKAAQTGRPIILSTGMSSIEEIELALGILVFGYLKINQKPSNKAFLETFEKEAAKDALAKNVSILHCTSEYPAPFDEVNLRAIRQLRAHFNIPVGYSDHTEGIAVCAGAAAMGARVLEKHLTLDRTQKGPDHQASIEPETFKQMVEMVRAIEQSLGSSEKTVTASEEKNRFVARKGLVAAEEILQGDVFSEKNLTTMRPCSGVSASHYFDWIGKKSSRTYHKGEQIEQE